MSCAIQKGRASPLGMGPPASGRERQAASAPAPPGTGKAGRPQGSSLQMCLQHSVVETGQSSCQDPRWAALTWEQALRGPDALCLAGFGLQMWGSAGGGTRLQMEAVERGLGLWALGQGASTFALSGSSPPTPGPRGVQDSQKKIPTQEPQSPKAHASRRERRQKPATCHGSHKPGRAGPRLEQRV